MSKFAWIAIICLLFSRSSIAKEERLNQESIRKLVKEFYLSKTNRQMLFEATEDCEIPKKGTCISIACSKMPSYYCDEKSELRDIALACSNVDGGCIENVCKRMQSYNCDEPSEVKTVALACKGLIDSDCINVVCSKMSSYNCDEFSELKEIIEMCKNP